MADSSTPPPPRWTEWQVPTLTAARRALPVCLHEMSEGAKDELLNRIIEAVGRDLGLEPDFDALLDNDLHPFELAESVLRVSANDGAEGFMGPSYSVYELFRLADGRLGAVNDRIETGEFALLGLTDSMEEACALIGEDALQFLEGGEEVIFEGIGTVVPGEIGPDRAAFWARFLLQTPKPPGAGH